MFRIESRGGAIVWRQGDVASAPPPAPTGGYAPRGKWSAGGRGVRARGYSHVSEGASTGNQTLTATLFQNQNWFGAHAISVAGGAQTLNATLFTNTNTFGNHTISLVSGGGSPSAVWNHTLEAGYTAADLLRIIAAAVAGRVSISGNVVTFTGLDGSTFRVVGTVDGSGNRTSVTHNGSQ